MGVLPRWALCHTLPSTKSLKTKCRQFDNFVVTVSCHNDNLRCHQLRQSCQIDDLLFSMKLTYVLMLSAWCVFHVFGCVKSVYHLRSHI